MFKLKLKALDYPGDIDNFNANDEKQFRCMVLWLEDQKIRLYTVNDREGLRQVSSNNWPQSFEKYKKDVNLPITTNSPVEILSWLLSYAVQLEYTDKKADIEAGLNKTKTKTPNVVAVNPLDNLDFQSEDFKKGVNSLAKILKITPHPNHLVTLKAIRKLVCRRLSTEALEKPENVIVKGNPFPYQDMNCGLDFNDPVLNQATKMLRLLHIQNLRQLQTQINELIVAVQSVTANPKTDTKLGKVGV